MKGMKMKRITLLLLVLAGVVLAGCAAPSTVFVARHNDSLSLESIALCPVQVVSREQVRLRAGARGDLLPFPLRLLDSEPSASAFASLLEAALEKEGKWNITPMGKTANILRGIIASNQTLDFPQALRLVGERLAVEAVLVCYLYRWDERQGVWYAARRPAAAAFELYLYQVSDGALVWRGVFDHTQQALTDNLLDIGRFFKNGFRWLSVEELARDGVAELIADLAK